jgi:serine/threonine protein kinase
MNLIGAKLNGSDLFDCTNMSPFIESITAVLPYEGMTSLGRLYDCMYDGIPFLTKVLFYVKTVAEIYVDDDYKPPADAEIAILQILQQKFVRSGRTPCIVELIYSKRCSNVANINAAMCQHNNLNPSSVPSTDLSGHICEFASLVESKLATDMMAFVVMEKCHLSLREFVRIAAPQPIAFHMIKGILFQLIFTLTVITDDYPQFRHGDLHDDNVMLKFDLNYTFDPSSPSVVQYKRNGKKWYVPYFGFVPKIIDFGHSTIPEEGIISAAAGDRKLAFYRAGIDILFLLHCIRIQLGSSNRVKLHELSEYDRFFATLDPTGLYIMFNTAKIRESKEVPESYSIMLESFKSYENKVPGALVYGKFSA